MAWMELTFQTNPDIAQCIVTLLEANGALAVTLRDAGDQPIYEPELGTTPLWDNSLVTGLFEEETDLKKILAVILTDFPTITYQLKELPEQDWERTWMEDFIPMQFGERLWVIPSYEQHDATPYHVILDPGLAFGTGKHPTTALCLRWLDQHIHGGEVVMDYGCGSGILGIAALKLGAKKVLAIDHDHQAIAATIDNAAKNNLKLNQIDTFYPQELTSNHQADIIVANILANPLIQLTETFYLHLKNGGSVVLSGILREQIDNIIETYSRWFEIKDIETQEDWVRVYAIKAQSS